MALAIFLCLEPAVAQTGAQVPLVETLGYRQMRESMQSAPSGNDLVDENESATATVSAVVDLGVPSETYYPVESQIEELVDEQIEPATLEEVIQTQWVDDELKQFGYDVFSTTALDESSFADMPIPDDYVISAGDQVIVQLYGKVNVEYNLVVSRDGQLLIPEFGPVQVAGLSFADMRELIVDGFDTRLIGAKAVVTLGEIRSIQVRMTGDVYSPGVHRINGLSTLLDALLATGGIKSSGSLRSIQLKRSGRVVAELDLYDLLLRGDSSQDVRLMHNDTIFIPALGDVVSVAGEVQRPGIYELTNETRIQEVLELAGGLMPTASLRDSHLERIQGDRYRTIVDFDSIFSSIDSRSAPTQSVLNTIVQNGDFVRILPVSNTMDNVVLLNGHVKRPGAYEFQTGAYFSDLILLRDQVLPNTDLETAMIVREDSFTKRLSVHYVNPRAAALDPGGEQDFALQPRDRIRVFNLSPDRAKSLESLIIELDRQATDYDPANTVSLIGHLRYSGRFPLEENTQLLDVINTAGGILPGTDMSYGIVARRTFPGDRIEMKKFRLGQALKYPETDANPIITPQDRIYLFDDSTNRSDLMSIDIDELRRQGSYITSENLVRANGLVLHPGEYPLEDDMRVSDLICASGGPALNAYGLQAELSRYDLLNGERRNLQQINLDSESIIRICAEMRELDRQNSADARSQKLAQFGKIEPGKYRNRVVDIVEPVRFVSGQAEISPDLISYLRRALAHYRESGHDVKVWVYGHTDNQPLSQSTLARYGSNQALSEARAEIVADLIRAELGDEIVYVEILGFGASRPLETNLTSSGRAKNRRVEIEFELMGDAPIADLVQGNALRKTVSDLDRESLGGLYFDDSLNPVLQPHDQLTFVQKPGWVEKARVTVSGEIGRPGIYVIDRGETLCSVIERAGGTTEDAYVFGAKLIRKSILDMQQNTLDRIQSQLDDLMVELSLSHSAMNSDKTPAGDNKEDYLEVIQQLERAEPSGRLVVDFDRASRCKSSADVVMENGDIIEIPTTPTHVNVAGQVYVPTTHMWRDDRKTIDYIELSGGSTVLGRQSHAYVIQANGEVMSIRGSRSSSRILNEELQPGATVMVPLNVDRMNMTERVQSWTRSLFEAAVFAGIVL